MNRLRESGPQSSRRARMQDNDVVAGVSVQTRSRTRSVVFTDMADYTKSVASADREGLRNILAQHQKYVEPVLTGRGGRVVKNIGDSFMALFETATDAVRASLDLVEAHAPGGSSGVVFRASIATGDVEEAENDAFGEPVNMSARINARTEAGAVCFSAGTMHCMNQAEIPWESTGRHTLKGIPGETEIFRAVPQYACTLPDLLAVAIKARTLTIWNASEPMPSVSPNGHLILEGFRPGSPFLTESVDRLPVVDPSRLWLSTYNISPADRIEWARSGRGLLIGTPPAFRAAVAAQQRISNRVSGSDTIILDGQSDACMDLVIAGIALPAVPIAEVVAGYSYDLLPDGRWLNRTDRAVLRVDVSANGVTVTVLTPGVQINGLTAQVNGTFTLVEGTELRCSGFSLRFYDLGGDEGYAGVLVGDTQVRVPMSTGQHVEIGREPQHPGLLLPDRNNQENIRWCPGPRAARAREKGFTLDKVLTGRRQCGLDVSGAHATLNALHETLPTVLLDHTRRVARVMQPRLATYGDLVMLGTTVVALREHSEG